MAVTLSDLFPGVEEIEDAYEEAVLLSSTKPDNRDLGYVSKISTTIEISIASKDYVIHQSPTLLSSDRATGTTGAVLWKVTPLVCRWLSHPKCPLWTTSLITPTSTILELGSGTSGLLALTLGPKVKKFVASDQEYCLKILHKNITENSSSTDTQYTRSSGSSKHKSRKAQTYQADISTIPLDWETDDVAHHPSLQNKIFDAVFACDCIYNESLIPSFIDTLAEVCALVCKDKRPPTLAIVAQEIRSPDVLEAFMTTFCKRFYVGRVADDGYRGMGVDELMEGGGYVVHVGILRQQDS